MNKVFVLQAITEGVIGAAVVLLLEHGIMRCINYLRLSNFKGSYKGYKMNGEPHMNRSYKIVFSFWKNQLIINQTSLDKGDWKAHIDINTWNSKIGIGDYVYNDENYKEKWGTMKIILNSKLKIITIEAIPQEADDRGIVRYKLIKN